MGSAASTPIKRQAKALGGRRYMGGMKPEKYFQVVVKKEHGEVLDILGFSDEEAFDVVVQFIAIDDDNSGEISVGEFHGHLNAMPTKFSERVFAILDQDMSGLLNLREFIVGIWNYCTYDTTLVSKLLFDVFDVDRRGKVTMAELDAMLRMLYGSPEADPDLLKLLAINGEGDEDALSFDEFAQVVRDNYEVAQPAFELQKALRRKVLGVKYWEKMTRKRTKMFTNYDQSDLTSAEAVEAIVTAKHKERLEELEGKKLQVAAEHDAELRRAAEEHRVLHEENQRRKIAKLEELRDARSVEEVEEENAWKDLRRVQAEMKVDFIEENVRDLRAAREVLWDGYDRAVASSRAHAKVKVGGELELASQDDATSKADAWILTRQGKVKYDFLCRQIYGNLLHRAYLESGPPMQAFAALHAPDDSPVTLATIIAFNHPRPAMLKEAKAAARANLVARFARQETADVEARAAKETAQQDQDFAALHAQSSAEARRMSASVGSLVATVTEVLPGLSGATGDEVWRELPDSDLVRRTWNSVRNLRDVHGVSEEAMTNIVPEVWRDRAFRAGEQGASGQSVAEVSPTHDAETISSSKA
eukprot:jgi/Undpi1/7350/HiC_scaffold_22.g09823.m1